MRRMLFGACNPMLCLFKNGLRLENSVYAHACAPNHVIASKDPRAWLSKDLTEQEFTPRSPAKVALCWD